MGRRATHFHNYFRVSRLCFYVRDGTGLRYTRTRHETG